MPRRLGPGAWVGAEADGVRSNARPHIGSPRPAQLASNVASAPGRREPPLAFETPPVGEADALDDRVWFGKHQERSFRSRRGAGGSIWIVRRAGNALLRVLIPHPLSSPARDSDGELGPLWFAAAWPSLIAEKAQKLGRQAARRGRRGGR